MSAVTTPCPDAHPQKGARSTPPKSWKRPNQGSTGGNLRQLESCMLFSDAHVWHSPASYFTKHSQVSLPAVGIKSLPTLNSWVPSHYRRFKSPLSLWSCCPRWVRRKSCLCVVLFCVYCRPMTLNSWATAGDSHLSEAGLTPTFSGTPGSPELGALILDGDMINIKHNNGGKTLALHRAPKTCLFTARELTPGSAALPCLTSAWSTWVE